LRFVSSMEIKEPRIYVKTITSQILRVFVVVMLLNVGLQTILYFSIDPVFMAGLNLAQTAGRISEDCTVEGIAIVSSKEGGLSQEMGNGILCTLKSVQDQIGDMFAMGHVLTCLGFVDFAFIKYIGPNLAYAFTGIMIYLSTLMLLLAYPFLLIDAVLKLSIAVALLPAALGAFAFKITAKYLNHVWETFLNGMFAFIFLSIIMLIISSAAADEVAKLLQSRDGMSLWTTLFWWSVEILKIAFICMLGYALLGETKSFADKFASGIQISPIGAMTGSTFNEYAYKKPGKFAMKTLGKGAKATGSLAKNIVGSYANNARMQFGSRLARSGWGEKNKFTRAISSFVGAPRAAYDENGNVMTDAEGNTLYDTTGVFQRLRGRQELTSYKKTSHNISQKSTVNDRTSGRIIKETQNDRYGSVKNRYDSAGNKISSEGKIRSITKGRLTRKDGTVDMAMIENFEQNSLLSEEDKQVIIAQKVMDERLNFSFSGARINDVSSGRKVQIATDDQGRKTVLITQKNMDNSTSSFKMTYCANNRVRFETETINANGKGIGFATDGIIEKKSYIEVSHNDSGGTQRSSIDRYAFSEYYSSRTSRPLYVNGDMSSAIPKDEITFGKEDMDAFVNQVIRDGNKYYSFQETK